jgi:hypothetical protein
MLNARDEGLLLNNKQKQNQSLGVPTPQHQVHRSSLQGDDASVTSRRENRIEDKQPNNPFPLFLVDNNMNIPTGSQHLNDQQPI